MKKLLPAMLLLSALPAHAAGADGVFAQGSTQFSLIAGNGYAFTHNYLVVGAGVNYYVADGLGIGLSYENWSGASPRINKISPSVQYVFDRASSAKPYAGGFYRHSVISGLPDINSLGARAGVYFPAGRRNVFGIGVAYESYLNCRATVYASCRETYPEISFIFGF